MTLKPPAADDRSAAPALPRRSAALRRAALRSAALLTAAAVAAVGLVAVGVPQAASALSGETRMHDTTAIQVDGCTWAYSTGFERDAANPTGAVTIHTTCAADQASGWTAEGPIWDTVPAWITARFNGVTPPNYWAPDISYFDGQYHLYYAASLWTNNQIAYMGLATADSPGGPWVDQGEVTDRNYPIDGATTRDANGQLWTTWGSWGGTYLHQLDESTGKLSTTNTSLVKIATGIENGTVLYRDGYYYLFGSKGSCCAGTSSTYFTAVGRSTSIGGPYLDKSGRDMLTGAGTTILTGSGTQVAAGGGDWYEADGSLFFVYHYYDATQSGRETGNIRPMSIIDGWPVLGTPVGAIVNTVAPTVTGAAHPGETLTVDTGQWNVADPTFAYAWSRNGVAITGASDPTYTTTAQDLGQQLSVTVTATKVDRDTLTVTTAARAVVLQTSLAAGLEAAASVDVSAYTLGSGEVFAREVAAIRAVSTVPSADEQQLLTRLGDAYAALVSDESLFVENPVQRPWVTASTPIFGNAGSAADNGWALFDDDLATFVSGATANGNVTVTPTDGSTFTIDRLRVYPRGENLHGRLVGHKFQGSNDGGATWQTFATLTTGVAGTWTTVDLPEPVAFERIRMLDDHNGYINAAEAELLERGVDTTLLDLLLADAAAVDASAYTEASVAELRAAQSAGQLTDPTQDEADAASARLRDAIAGLAPVPVQQVPDAPAKPAIGVADAKVNVTFTAPVDNGSAITGFTVTLTPAAVDGTPVIATVGPAARTASFANVAPGSYTASVVAASAAGDSAASVASATAVVGQGTPVELVVKATSVCVGGTARLAVGTLNASGAAADIRLTTRFGEKKSSGVRAGSTAYAVFDAKVKRIAGGTATVAGYQYVDGVGYYSTYTAKYPGRTCR